MLVHTLEHGRINVQYKKGTPAADVAKLEALLAEQNEGYHMLLYENTTDMEPAVAATAWTHSLTCPDDERQGVRRDPDVPGPLHRQGPRDRPLGRRRRRSSRA